MLASIAILSGRSLVGFARGRVRENFCMRPTTGQHLQPGCIPATGEEVELAARLRGGRL